MFKKKNLPLILGFSIPILMILFVAVSIYVPGLFEQPKYNFLYVTQSDYATDKMYSVTDGKLVEVMPPEPSPEDDSYNPPPTPKFYTHDVKTNKSRAVTLQEAEKLNLDGSLESPDGYEIADGSNNGGFFLFGGYGSNAGTKYIIGHNVSKKLNVEKSGTSYYNTIKFLGWIVQ